MDYTNEDDLLDAIQCPYCGLNYPSHEKSCKHLIWKDIGEDFFFLEMEVSIPREQFFTILEKVQSIREGIDGEYYFVSNPSVFKGVLAQEIEKEDEFRPSVDIKISKRAEDLILEEKRTGENYTDVIVRIFETYQKNTGK
jgi:hypothetical protein